MQLCLAELLTCVQLKQKLRGKYKLFACFYNLLLSFSYKFFDYICMSLGLETNFVSES